jgi:hypothetical protein
VVALGSGNMQQMSQESVTQSVRCCGPVVPTLPHRTSFLLFGPLKQHLGGRQFHNNEELGMAACEWLRRQEHDFFRDGIFKLVPSWDKCVSVLGGYVEK